MPTRPRSNGETATKRPGRTNAEARTELTGDQIKNFALGPSKGDLIAGRILHLVLELVTPESWGGGARQLAK